MVLPTTGAISLAQVQAEFGGANPITITEYYRNNVLVKNITENANVPVSGGISLSNFRGASYTRGFGIEYLGGGSGGDRLVNYEGRVCLPDPRRIIIVVQGCATGNTGLRPIGAATIANQLGNVIFSQFSTVFDDGQTVTVTALQVKTGVNPSIYIPTQGTTTHHAAFALYGHNLPLISIISRQNQNGGDDPLPDPPGTSIPISTPAGSAVMYIAYGNGGGGPGADPTEGRLNVYVNTGIGVGFDTDPAAGTTTYTYQGFGLRPALLAAISFYKEF